MMETRGMTSDERRMSSVFRGKDGFKNIQHSIAPLVVFRILFGFIMLVSLVRFAVKGWIEDLYVTPAYYFTFYGFDWVQPLGSVGMYVVFFLMGLAALGIMLGWRYRIAAVVFFVLFTYVELIDKSNYLNHYYFVSIISFLLMFVPAHRSFSIDVLRDPALEVATAPAWTINIFKLQLAIVYFFAGLAKLNPDWLFEAMPLRIWLPANAHLPVIGWLLELPETAFVFSWAGAFYDLTIPFFLLYRRTRLWAYAAVVGFHLMTGMLFQIGMFPYIMVLCTLIFFSPVWHQQCIDTLRDLLRRILPVRWLAQAAPTPTGVYQYRAGVSRWIGGVLALHFFLQLLLPMRAAVYPGSLFWTEQGYRFSWRVMLMEKAGYTVFHVHDPRTGKTWEVSNWDYLTPNQEKMMATQPDMILQFAHFLEGEYQKKGMEDVEITADSYVSLNGRRSRRFIDPSVDLTQVRQGFAHKDWILPFEDTAPQTAAAFR